MNYAEGICDAFRYLLTNYKEVFAIGQGLWSPWYVGATMTDLDKEFGTDRVIDTPVSELATTGAAVGASLFGYRPIIIHPRMDFMVLARAIASPSSNEGIRSQKTLASSLSCR